MEQYKIYVGGGGNGMYGGNLEIIVINEIKNVLSVSEGQLIHQALTVFSERNVSLFAVLVVN